MNTKYINSKNIYDNLLSEIKLFQEDLDLINYGVYEPTYDFQTSEKYTLKLLEIKQKQKLLYKEDKAITSSADEIYYTAKFKFLTSSYKKSINNYKKIISNAFNSETDKLILKVKWNNINASIERIQSLGYKINTYSRDFCSFLLLQNSVITGNYHSSNFEDRYNNHMIIISDELIKLKIEEIKIKHEYELIKHEEKEEQKEIRATIREEDKKLIDDLSKAIIKDFITEYEKLSSLTKETLEPVIKSIIDKHKTNFKGVGQPLRIALVGSRFGPGLYDVILSLDKGILVKRLNDLT